MGGKGGKAKALRLLARAMGIACVAIGLLHVVGGNAAIPGAQDAGATVDSLGRFLGAAFAGYGLTWLWVARQTPVPATAVRVLIGVFLLGGLARVLSIAVAGWPHGFQVALMVVELTLSPVYFWLADADEEAARSALPART
ncbi:MULTISPECIES: DUF4345 domain-containing protein [unclassified Streptomyces]|uniref:DUF4345 domain-containing protein n=1 Tax=unclassified Streptomyces TaxID=2593676 RepID=UPI00109EA8B6|nr:DUF4345 domain-containing protein [Streptomyces sp. A1136]THA51124.1 DUF4345 domain-containing protein [Streptomyces sp. A1136]